MSDEPKKPNRCIHGVLEYQDCFTCNPTAPAPQASEGCSKCGRRTLCEDGSCHYCEPWRDQSQVSEVRTWWIMLRDGGLSDDAFRSEVDYDIACSRRINGEPVRVIEHAAYLRLAAELEQAKNQNDPLNKRIELDGWRIHDLTSRAEAAEARVADYESGNTPTWREEYHTQLSVSESLDAHNAKMTAERDHAQAEVKRLREALENLLDRWRKCGAEKTTSFAIVEKALKDGGA